MRVLIADKFEQSGRDQLDAAGCEFSYQPDVKDDTLVEAIRAYQPDALVVRSTKVTEQLLDAGALKLIVRAGARQTSSASTSPLNPKRAYSSIPTSSTRCDKARTSSTPRAARSLTRTRCAARCARRTYGPDSTFTPTNPQAARASSQTTSRG